MAITRYVNTASSPGGDGTTNATTGDNRAFASLNEAEAAIPASIADWYDIVCEGQNADSTAVDFAGTTTSASNYVQIRTDPGATYGRHGGKWNADKYRLSLTSGTAYPLQIHEPYVRIIGLQVYGWYQTVLHLANSQSDNSVIDSCIIWHGSSGNNPCLGDYGGATGNAKYVNSIFIQDAAERNLRLRGGGTKVLNCVAIGGTYGYRHETLSTEIINSIGIGASEADFSGSFSGSTGNNASSDDSAPGSNSLTEIDPAAAFTDYTNGDFSLKSGSPLIDAGIGPALDSDVPTTDIVGTSRSGNTCDIGAFEFVGGGVVHQGECIESLAFSDVSTRTAIFQAMAVESLALSSITGPQARFQGAALDVLSLSDAGMVQAILRGLASETLVLSDRADRARIISVEIEDTLALSDSAARQATYRATATDTLTLSESIAVSAIYLAAAVELLAFSDASSGDFPAEAIQGECIETLALSATASARLNALATALDRIGLSGSASAILHAAAQAVENLVLSDAAAWGSIIQALAEEHLLLSDEAATTLTMIGQAIETLALSDGALPKMTFQVEATESMAFSDAAATIARFAAVCAETIGFSDMAVHFEPKGMVTITFESKKGSITFSLKKGTITFQ